ncbi:YtkA-like [Alteribacillus persepolensis]|uniref:YtkA-like n=1 Tax=Alteribacillus persepolensis TaxID=568899 RepID=A0A1G8FLE8_9BACI|nr:FixH family protein [Alteribacillus persepolensis]SDH82970.1 YtkA-like [Alteribacillus persepolensis]
MKKISVFLGAVLFIGACGQTDGDTEETNDIQQSSEPIDVEIDMDEAVSPEESVEIGASVTQAGETVTDADEVLFEIWKEEQKAESEEIPAEEPANHQYVIEHAFAETGTYYVTAHVTARGMHSMPTEEIIVSESGKIEDAEVKEEDIHAGHEHGAPVTAELVSPSSLQAEEELELTFQVANEGSPIEDARVRLEIWQKGDDTRQWLDTEESGDMYTAVHTFESPGDYFITIHIENGEDLHEHVDKLVTVK